MGMVLKMPLLIVGAFSLYHSTNIRQASIPGLEVKLIVARADLAKDIVQIFHIDHIFVVNYLLSTSRSKRISNMCENVSIFKCGLYMVLLLIELLR